MSQPPYVRIMMLSPIESAIMDFKGPVTKPATIEGMPLVPEDTNENTEPTIFVQKQRFGLFIWFAVTSMSFSTWFTSSTMIPVLQLYYKVNFLQACMVFMTAPVVLAIMALLLHRQLVDKTADPSLMPVFAVLANAVGTGIKCRGTNQGDFGILMSGQILVYVSLAFSLSFLLTSHKQSSSCNPSIIYLGLSAACLGCISGIIVPAFAIPLDASLTDIGWQIYKMFLWNAVISTCVLILLPFALKEQKKKNTTRYHSNNDDLNPAGPSYLYQARTNDDDTTIHVDCTSAEERESLFRQLISFLSNRQRCFYLLITGLAYAMFISTFLACHMVFDKQPDLIKEFCATEAIVILLCLMAIFLTVKYRLGHSKWTILVLTTLSFSVTIAFAFSKNRSLEKLEIAFYFFSHTFMALHVVGCVSNGAQRFISFESVLLANFFIQLLAVTVGFIALLLLAKLSFNAWLGFFWLLSLVILCLSFNLK